MRADYREALTGVSTDLVQMADLVREAVSVATTALLQADLAAAEQVISGDAHLDALHDDLESRCFVLLARQAPVAGELRTIVAALRMVADLARMGDLAAHVAKIARMRYPKHAVPDSMVPNFQRMSSLAEEMVAMASKTLAERNVLDAEKMADNDEEVDNLRTMQFRKLLDDSWEHGVEAAVDCALLGRYYERIADHAVILSSRVIYVVTGLHPEGDNWSIA
ncbi:phosphate signaling complex protein PhoU [Propioniciclava tarda]|uniref:Phosphate-specific transport system accessory protein PhoU n=1 Tax=Propioniciclava tarda TaxID=433330 RepID=A0A4Q9KKE2_PROTD|nr:phosphate signaling complex protein PhoU [Propioniciclava tarda]TBT94645.1 phosphate signaling complex protein PhoU [Propioniciclava tarda]SMO66943.1 phosphate transport system protein [Propioniciclava tarda]HOA90007.1 phosphate signaling complex protein PhoU [Propioniciclava tarda]HQA30292.1 phosphate signaling complex protein PhoU [Propioniciclava tarda]HQD61505.1 phosphate signaling complex protein PhoU [Propioniciclava tarda]